MTDFEVKGIDHVFVCSGKWQASMRFWRDVLGLEVLQDWSSGDYHGAAMKLGAERLTVAEGEVERDQEVGFRVEQDRPYLYFRVQGLDALVDHLRRKGIKILGGPVKLHWGPRMASAESPDGFPVMFVEG